MSLWVTGIGTKQTAVLGMTDNVKSDVRQEGNPWWNSRQRFVISHSRLAEAEVITSANSFSSVAVGMTNWCPNSLTYCKMYISLVSGKINYSTGEPKWDIAAYVCWARETIRWGLQGLLDPVQCYKARSATNSCRIVGCELFYLRPTEGTKNRY